MLKIQNISKNYPGRNGSEATRAISSVSFEVGESQFVAVVGPSGCGKSTLLRCISGLMKPTGGSVTLNGHAVVAPPREMAMVFQDYNRSLFPWMTVQKNVSVPIEHKLSTQETREVVARAIESVGLSGFENHYPRQLSGGMQQRTAIARALAYDPQVLVMDEPFASVDAQTRFELEDLIMRIRRETGVTVLLVTHDIDEAIYMSDRVVVLSRQPSIVLEVLDVPLPEERDQVETKALADFQKLRGRVYEEVTRAHQK